jgi:hypothetical protein
MNNRKEEKVPLRIIRMDQNIDTNSWREDLRYLAAELPKRHQNLFHTMSRAQFEQAIAALDTRIPELARHQVIVELARIVALIGDGHSRLDLAGGPNIGFRRYPLRLYLYSDGLFVQVAGQAQAQAVGGRVLAIGDTPIAQAYARVRELIARDNEVWVQHMAPGLLAIPEVLHSLGLIRDMEGATLTIAQRSGEQATIELQPVAPDTPGTWMDAADDTDAPMPFWLRAPENNFWFTHLRDTNTLYVQYNAVRDKPEETVAEFFDKVFTFADARQVERFVLDIRRNGGGNGYLNQPIIHGLIKRDWINQPGKLFTIIGRATYSAAMMLTDDLEKHTRTLFVGEPTGASPNMYGDAEKIVLPNSGLEIWASALHWVYSEPRDGRPWIAPNIPAALSFEDYRARRDPALEAVLRHTPSPADAETVAFPDRLWREIAPLPEAEELARRARYIVAPSLDRAGARSDT